MKKQGRKFHGETEKYVPPIKEKKEYTLYEMKASFKRGVITVLVVQAIILSVFMYFRSHSINDATTSLKTASTRVVSLFQKDAI